MNSINNIIQYNIDNALKYIIQNLTITVEKCVQTHLSDHGLV